MYNIEEAAEIGKKLDEVFEDVTLIVSDDGQVSLRATGHQKILPAHRGGERSRVVRARNVEARIGTDKHGDPSMLSPGVHWFDTPEGTAMKPAQRLAPTHPYKLVEYDMRTEVVHHDERENGRHG